MKGASWGVGFATVTAVIWGGQFVVGKSEQAGDQGYSFQFSAFLMMSRMGNPLASR